MPDSSNTFPVGIDYSNNPKPLDNEFGEGNLTPYVFIGGDSIFSSPNPISIDENYTVRRFAIYTANLKHPDGEQLYPNYAENNALLNLDTIQIGTLGRGESSLPKGFGKKVEVSDPPDEVPYWTGAETYEEGVYSAPCPPRGGPIEFRKIYFRGRSTDGNKGHITSTGEQTFCAYFACSLPVEQTIEGKENPDDPDSKYTIFNSRNANFEHSEYASLSSWENIDIGGGGGAASCYSFLDTSGNSTQGLGSDKQLVDGVEHVICDDKNCEKLCILDITHSIILKFQHREFA